MDKYETLIGLLRDDKPYGNEHPYARHLMSQAADAIENLSRMIEKNMHVIENLKDSQHHLLNVKRHETCIDCPLYDKDNHRCPRFNAVIPEVLIEAPQVDKDINVLTNEPRKGEWIRDGINFTHGVDWIHCSVCGRKGINVPADLTNFCPNCGADMRGEGETG